MYIYIYKNLDVDIYIYIIYTCVCMYCVNPQTLCQYEQFFDGEFHEFDLRTVVRPKMQVLGLLGGVAVLGVG